MANTQAEGAIIFCNDKFCQLFGFSKAEVMQQNVDGSFLYGELTTSDSIAQLKQALASAEESQLDIVYYKKDGQYFYFSFNTNSIPTTIGRSELFLSLIF